jgi:beta-galactosidase
MSPSSSLAFSPGRVRWGVSYYPELVDSADWERDLDRMVSCKLDHIRALDFAWSALEPREGEYSFEWCDRFVELCAARGLALILCTPTATPPAWLARQFPEIMLADRRLQPRSWGNRREADVDSPIYQHFSRLIAEQMARRYGRHPAVLGWQIDNELVGSELLPPEGHSRASQWRFRDFLKRRHGRIEALNRRWGMRFWCQEFSAWGEVDTPHHDRPCQGHHLDYCRYFSESIQDYLVLQRDAIRLHAAPFQWIGHNSTAVFDRGLDHIAFGAELEMPGWDAYYGAAGGKARCDVESFSAMAHDMFRAIHQRPFWIYETNPCSGQFTPAYAAEMVARGAAGICFWHWRAHRTHVEQGCSTFCDYAGKPIADRVEKLAQLLARAELGSVASPSGPRPAVLLFPFDTVRAQFRRSPYGKEDDVTALRAAATMYGALRRIGVACDVRGAGGSLEGYAMIVAPMASVLSEQDAAAIASAVEKGATLFACGPTAHFDDWGAYRTQLGGPLSPVIQLFTSRNESLPEGARVRLADGASFAAAGPAERIVPKSDAKVLAWFEAPEWEGTAAAFLASYGQGNVAYMACDPKNLADAVAPEAAEAAGLPYLPFEHADFAVFPDMAGRGIWKFNFSQVLVGGIQPGGFRLDPN